jgi:hypothetical protein
LSLPSGSVRIIRERQIITHKSAHERDIEREITISNETDGSIRSIFLQSDFFMPGLKILDAEQNEYTMQYFRSKSKSGPLAIEATNKLQKMEKHELYILWIRFPNNSPMNKGEPKIIKLNYHDTSVAPSRKGRRLIRKQRFLFSIPEYQDLYRTGRQK